MNDTLQFTMNVVLTFSLWMHATIYNVFLTSLYVCFLAVLEHFGLKLIWIISSSLVIGHSQEFLKCKTKIVFHHITLDLWINRNIGIVSSIT